MEQHDLNHQSGRTLGARGTAGWSAELLARAQAYSERAGSTAVMIVQRGRVVAQWGDIARKSPIASVRKSLPARSTASPSRKRKIRLDTTLAELGIDDKQPLTAAEKQATVADLLTTRSGVYHPVDSQPVDLAGALPARGSHPPGTHFYYNNWDFNVLGTIYEQQTGEGIYESFKRRIADPIGLQDFVVSDGAWGPGEISNHRNYGFKHERARPRALRHAVRARRRVGRPPGRAGAWVDESTRTHAGVRSQTFAGRGYGYHVVDRLRRRLRTDRDGARHQFFAFGIGAQYLFVLPAHDLVIVHTVDMAPRRGPRSTISRSRACSG